MIERIIKQILAGTLLFNSCVHLQPPILISHPKVESYGLENDFAGYLCKEPRNEEDHQLAVARLSTFKKNYLILKPEMRPRIFYKDDLNLIEKRLKQIDEIENNLKYHDYSNFHECIEL